MARPRHVLLTSDVVVSPSRVSVVLSRKDAEGFGFGGTGKKSRLAGKRLSAIGRNQGNSRASKHMRFFSVRPQEQVRRLWCCL